MVAIIITIVITAVTAFFWVEGITYIKDKYPDYKGKDLFE